MMKTKSKLQLFKEGQYHRLPKTIVNIDENNIGSSWFYADKNKIDIYLHSGAGRIERIQIPRAKLKEYIERTEKLNRSVRKKRSLSKKKNKL